MASAAPRPAAGVEGVCTGGRGGGRESGAPRCRAANKADNLGVRATCCKAVWWGVLQDLYGLERRVEAQRDTPSIRIATQRKAIILRYVTLCQQGKARQGPAEQATGWLLTSSGTCKRRRSSQAGRGSSCTRRSSSPGAASAGGTTWGVWRPGKAGVGRSARRRGAGTPGAAARLALAARSRGRDSDGSGRGGAAEHVFASITGSEGHTATRKCTTPLPAPTPPPPHLVALRKHGSLGLRRAGV
jgi:hypothetical protein